MTDFKKIAKSIAVHFAHICAYGVETVKKKSFIMSVKENQSVQLQQGYGISFFLFCCLLISSFPLWIKVSRFRCNYVTPCQLNAERRRGHSVARMAHA